MAASALSEDELKRFAMDMCPPAMISHLSRFRSLPISKSQPLPLESSSVEDSFSRCPRLPKDRKREPLKHADDQANRIKCKARVALLQQRKQRMRSYTHAEKRARLAMWKWKRARRAESWAEVTIKNRYECRRKVANRRLRVRGRFISKQLEEDLKLSAPLTTDFDSPLLCFPHSSSDDRSLPDPPLDVDPLPIIVKKRPKSFVES